MYQKQMYHHIPNTVLLFIIIAPISMFWYALYIFQPSHAGSLVLYGIQLFADCVSFCIIGSLWITILLDTIRKEQSPIIDQKILKTTDLQKSTVDVFIPVANEPIDIITETISAVLDMSYPHRTIVLDDGNSSSVQSVIKKLGAEYYRRIGKKEFAKSGNLNFGLTLSNADFFAVFDSDHVPKKNFITTLLPYFSNEKIALVQTPQTYSNIDKFIARGSALSQDIFYRYIQPSKNSYNAAFCVGTNMMYRRSAIDSIGGIAKRHHSEDIWTTILLHEQGYHSLFHNEILAVGRGPETIEAYFRQQNRWARGGFTMFFERNPLLNNKLNLDQRIQYFFSNIHYFSGFAILIYLFMPIIFLLTGHHPMNLNNSHEWIIHYLPFAATVWLLPLFLLQSFSLATIATSLASFVPYISAFLSVLFHATYTWISTESSVSKKKPIMVLIWPIVGYIILSFASIFVGFYHPTDIITTTFCSFWIIVNSYVLYLFVTHIHFDLSQSHI
jgi:cellulose synthase (UDP-forming)